MKKLIGLISLVAALTVNNLYAQPESMKLTVSESITVNTTPAKLWELLGDFNSLEKWHPAIVKSELQGSGKNKGDIRTLTLAEGGQIDDELIEFNQEKNLIVIRSTKHRYQLQITSALNG